MTADFNFEPGKTYRIIHKSETQRVPRVSHMVYLGTRGHSDVLSFSARPVAGTQTMPRSWIVEAIQIPPMSEIFVNRRQLTR